MEVVDSILLSQLIIDFEAGLEEIFEQFEFFRFPVEREHRCRKSFWQFGNSVDIFMEIC